MSDQLKFFKGSEIELADITAEKGAIYHCTDTQNTYMSHDGATLTSFANVDKQIIYANKDNWKEMIKYAKDGATIKLAAGVYDLLALDNGSVSNHTCTFNDKTYTYQSFPNDLTIEGVDKNTVILLGVSISSGRQNNSNAYRADESSGTLSKNLTIKKVTVQNAFCVKNGKFDGINVISCVLKGGVFIAPNSYYDSYGIDGASSNQAIIRFKAQRVSGKNLRINGCTIDGALNISKTDPTASSKKLTTKSNIYIQDCENIILQSNTLSNCVDDNAIALKSSEYYATPGSASTIESSAFITCSGDIRIAGNKILSSKGSGIYIANLKDAYNSIMYNGFLKDVTCDESGKYIYICNCFNTSTRLYRQSTSDASRNYYDSNASFPSSSSTKVSMTTPTSSVTSPQITITGSEDYSTEAEVTSKVDSLKNTVNSNLTSLESRVNSKISDNTTALNTHTGHFSNPHLVRGTQLLDKDDLNWKTKTINISPNDVPTSDIFSQVIKDAQAGSVIKLAAGNYPMLILEGKDAFRRDITIEGTREHVSGKTYNNISHIDGIAISSNVEAYYARYGDSIMACDKVNAIMSDNLVFKNLVFDRSFSLVNAEIRGLVIDNCVFEYGARAEICPNKVNNCFNMYSQWSDTYTSFPHFQARYAYNPVIKKCTFKDARRDATAETPTNQFNANHKESAIYLVTVEGCTIVDNVINGAEYNGIQVTGIKENNRNYQKSTGKIIIVNNTIRNTGSRSIRLSIIEEADVVLLFNKMYNKDGLASEDNKEAVKISCDRTSLIRTRYYENTVDKVRVEYDSNKYEDVDLAQVTSATEGIYIAYSAIPSDYQPDIYYLQSQINALQNQLNNLIVASNTFDPNSSTTWPTDENTKFVVKY